MVEKQVPRYQGITWEELKMPILGTHPWIGTPYF